jgi:hypothetical protein
VVKDVEVDSEGNTMQAPALRNGASGRGWIQVDTTFRSLLQRTGGHE